MTAALAELPLAELVEDLNLYPRTQVSAVNVANLVGAIEAGYELPPIIVGTVGRAKAKRVVDGFHRRRAYLRVLGADGSVAVEVRSYANEAELFADAVATNARHGLPLQEIEKRRIVLRLGDLGVSPDQIAHVLQTTADKVEKIQLKVATIVDDNGGSVRLEPLKRPLFHLQGAAMTEAQAKAQRSAPGTSYLLTIRQLSDAVKFDLINASDGRVLAALRELASDLEGYLAAR